MKLNRRLHRLEARVPADDHGEAGRAFVAALCDFMVETFGQRPGEALADVAARCCGLPDAPALRQALIGGLTADAVISAGESRFGPSWRENMTATMMPMLDVCMAKGGVDTLFELACFPPVADVVERLGINETGGLSGEPGR